MVLSTSIGVMASCLPWNYDHAAVRKGIKGGFSPVLNCFITSHHCVNPTLLLLHIIVQNIHVNPSL
jgi:hypothetical protein